MNTLSRIVEKNYNIFSKIPDKDSVRSIELQKKLFNIELQKDINYFNEKIEPKPSSLTYITSDTIDAIQEYRQTGDRTSLDNLSGTLINVKDVKRNKFLLNDDLKRNKITPWIVGILGAGLGVGAGYLFGEPGYEIISYVAGGLSGGGFSAATTKLNGRVSELKVKKTIQEANMLDIKLDILGIRDRLNTSKKEY